MVAINPTGNSLYAKDYTTDFDLEIQQKQSLLQPHVDMRYYGAGAILRQAIVRYGRMDMKPITGTGDKIVAGNLTSVQRWLTGNAFSVANDWNVFLQGPLTKQNVRDAIVMAQKAAYERKQDEIILGALFANALTGTDGGSTAAYDANNTIAANVGASANTGLNITKFEAVKKRMTKNGLTKNYIDEFGGIVMILDESGTADLRTMIEANNSDFSAAYQVVRDSNGNISKFYGFDIIEVSSDDLAAYTDPNARLLNGSLRRVPVFLKKAITVGTWADKIHRVTDETSLEGDVKRFYTAMNMGATRIDEKLVYDIQMTIS